MQPGEILAYLLPLANDQLLQLPDHQEGQTGNGELPEDHRNLLWFTMRKYGAAKVEAVVAVYKSEAGKRTADGTLIAP